MTSDTDGFMTTRRTLLVRLKEIGDDASWQEFFDIYGALLYRFASQTGLARAEAEDVVQDTVLAVTRSIGQFTYDPERCSFRTWLRRVTERRIVDQFRRRRREPLAEDIMGSNDFVVPFADRAIGSSFADLEALWDQEWNRAILAAATARVKQVVKPDQFQIYDCYVLRGWPVTKVARTLDVSVSMVYLAKHRISKLMKRELQRLERDKV